ncbi:MAG TPA: putative sugar nucleotidyl transferase [Gemmatimonas sp.]|uniref:putative sugar nucleotidyl transferase n=1 Tax=Gemmatimonas sp. TaxID=1962908 RepID=UPI002ED8F038
MIVLYDDAEARRFEPFTATRPLCEMRAGALLVRERWQLVLGASSSGFVAAPHLDGFAEFDAPPALIEEIPAGTWLVNSRAIPTINTAPTGDVLRIGDRVAAVRLTATLSVAAWRSGKPSLESIASAPAVAIEGRWMNEVWDLVDSLVEQLNSDIPRLAQRWSLDSLAPDVSTILGQHPVFVESGATIEPMCVFDVTAGPVLVRRGATVQAFTRVVGPCYVGVDSSVTTDRVAASSIGDVCRVHGELSTSILIGHANKGHDGFVGHSILGRWVNLGAGTITSNLKNTYGTVSLWTPDGVRDTGLQFLGTLFGDHAKSGIGLRLTTGCVIGAGANVYDRMPPKAVAPFSWGGGAPYTTFAVDKFLDMAGRMMARRHVDLSASARAWWEQVHAAGVTDPRWPRD